jgi:hypothetical protein
MTIPEWLAGSSLPDGDRPCRLTLRHLRRAHIDLLCAYEGISDEGSRLEAVKRLELHLSSKLAHDTILTPLPGMELS